MEADYLREDLSRQLLAKDRDRCRKLQADIAHRRTRNQPTDRLEAKLIQLVDSSLAQVARRRQSIPLLDYPEDLPVSAQRQDILDALGTHQLIIVAGATGSGKTTQLPKLCLESGFGTRGRIGHTQPRRIAARTVASRIAQELNTPVGELLGYQVRFTDHCGDNTLVKLMTDGILLAEIQRDPCLDQYDALIIDEAHERSLNIDFLLGYLKNLLPKRPDLKVVVTSATIDVDSFSRYFEGAPVVDVSGRTWPVDVHYLPPSDTGADIGLPGQVLNACQYIRELEWAGEGHEQGDILVFLPGERDIRDCALVLRRAELPHWDILPLYARLGRAEQNRVFELSGRRGRRVVLATNVAETSLTVPGIRYVIDSGVARISRYSHRSRVQRLPIEAVSRASAQQRSGRCGREAPGTCIRLYSEDDFAARPEYTDSEIHRTNLASVILQLTRMRFGDIERFPFIEAPDSRLVRDGYSLLEELGAIHGDGQISPVGESLSRIPADPRIGRMLLAAGQFECVAEVLIVAAGLSIQDPRERPLDKQQAADQAHSRFHCDESDFLALIKLWHYFEEQRQRLSKNQLRKLCRQEFLSWTRMYEWRDLHHQLSLVCRELGMRINQQVAGDDAVHRAILAGLISHIGQRLERREYLGARNRKFRLFPGSRLAKKPPPWLMATELVDTGVVYGRVNGRIRPEWVIEAAPQLLQRSYSEPHYSSRRQAVVAQQKISLYGLVLSDNERIAYGPVDPVAAREIFLRAALTEGGLRSNAGFWRHNQGLVQEIAELEVRSRRHDLLVDDEAIYRFYDARVPAGVCSKAKLDRWRKQAEQEAPRLLYLSREQLLCRQPGSALEQQFPDVIEVAGLALPLRYTFAPGGDTDGVTVTVPLAVLNRVSPADFDWLVPGLLRDKCIELVKSLPRPLRKQLVPVPDTVDRALSAMTVRQGKLTTALARTLREQTGVEIPDSAWQPDKLDPFYHMHFSVLDGSSEIIDSGRDLAHVQQRLAPQFRDQIVSAEPAGSEKRYQDWNFGSLLESVVLNHGGMEVLVYPALVDKVDSVALEHCDSHSMARRKTCQGLARLYLLRSLQQVKYLKKEFLRGNEISLQLRQLADRDALLDDYLMAVYRHHFVEGRAFPADAAEFNALLQEHKGGAVSLANDYHALLQQIVALNHDICSRLSRLKAGVWQYAIDDIAGQLAGLLREHFLRGLALEHLREYPRYLRGIVCRIEKLDGHQQKDRRACEEMGLHIERLRQVAGEHFEDLPRSGELTDYRWLLEEYRLSLFAQNIGARKPVSAKRLDKAWQRWLATQT